MAHYVLDSNPFSIDREYGANRSLFPALMEEAIEVSTRELEQAVSDKENLQEFFHKWIASVAERRQQISVRMGEKDAPQFGKRRDLAEKPIPFSYTVLHREDPKTDDPSLVNSYNACNQKILKTFREHLKTLPPDSKRLSYSDQSLGRTASFEWEIFDQKDLIKNGWLKAPRKEVHEFLSAQPEKIWEEPVIEKLRLLKEKRPEVYFRDHMHEWIKMMHAGYPSSKSEGQSERTQIGQESSKNLRNLYLLGTARLEIDGRPSTLTRYFTWLYKNPQEDPLERMEKCSKVFLFHTDITQIQENLKDIAKLFERAMQWNRQDHSISDLKQRVALFRYEFAHVMPYCRGGGSIGECLEAALYRWHGFKDFRPNPKVELEAFGALTLAEFWESYNSIVSLEGESPSETKEEKKDQTPSKGSSENV